MKAVVDLTANILSFLGHLWVPLESLKDRVITLRICYKDSLSRIRLIGVQADCSCELAVSRRSSGGGLRFASIGKSDVLPQS